MLSPEEAYGVARKAPEEVWEILARLRAGLEDLYAPRLKGLYLIGSYARGDARAGSDLDVLIVLDEIPSYWEEIQRTSELTASLSLEYEVTVSKIFMSDEEWEQMDTPLLRNLRRESIPVNESHDLGMLPHHSGGHGNSSTIASPAEAYGLRRKTPEEVREILAQLRAGLEELYGPRLRGIVLFGSYARADAVAGSDLDVLVVLDDYESSWKEIDRTGELTTSLSLEYDVTIANIFVREAKWRDGKTPFLSNIRREGIPA